jgi:Bacterial toxin 44
VPARESLLINKRTTRLGTLVGIHKAPESHGVKSSFQSPSVHPTGAPVSVAQQQNLTLAPILKYIVDEMKANAESTAVKVIRALNNSPLPGAQVEAGVLFTALVYEGHSWDYKTKIHGVAQKVSFAALGHPGEFLFYYSVWKNIHFGYIANAAGFPGGLAKLAATLDHKYVRKRGFSPESDVVAFDIGFDLYAEGDPDPMKLLRKLYEHRCHLYIYKPNDPNSRTAYACHR